MENKKTPLQKAERAAEQPEKNNDYVRVRSANVDAIKKVDGNERQRILSFSSEEPYLRWFGLEILDHSEGAINLTRLNEIGVLLFNHDTNQVVGKIIKAWVEDSRGYAQVEFDSDEAAELIYQKVVSGTLKGVSTRYTLDSIEEVSAGATSADGKKGPCDIVRKWTPLEVSIVSVPADASVGVGREMEFVTPQITKTELPKNSLGAYERQIEINKNYL